MKVTQITIGRFHHFHLARQMERFGLLEDIYTGYPLFKLNDEQGIPREKIKTFPWLHAPYMSRGKVNLDKFKWLNKQWEWLDKQTLDKYASTKITHPTVLIALSGSGLNSGKKTQKIGGKYICDRGSSHIKFQDSILTDEYKRWGFKFKGVDPRVIGKEEEEYATADRITVPSEFVRKSFIQMGVPESKIVKIKYGARLDRFKKVASPASDKFTILWVGGITIRKGFMYALDAFQKFNHPNKEFVVIGNIESEMKQLLKGQDLTGINFMGNIPNSDLPMIYSSAHVFVLASIEEGLAMVQGEALACGCPIIATTNTGCEDLFTNGKEGFIIPIRSSSAILEKFEQLAGDSNLRSEMSVSAIERVKSLGGWDSYGEEFKQLVQLF